MLKLMLCFFSQIGVFSEFETHPAERHHVESVAATVQLVEEVAVCVMRSVVNLQLVARVPVD